MKYWNRKVFTRLSSPGLIPQVLLARNSAWPAGWFALITGFLEQGETPEQAVLREVEEEIGLRGSIESFVGNYAFMEQNQLLVVYHVVAAGTIRLNHEIAEVKLQPASEVRPWRQGTGPALYDWLLERGENPQFI